MAQVLLKNNLRASLVLAVLAAAPVGLGVVLVCWGQRAPGDNVSIIAILGWLLIVGGACLLARQLWWSCIPRLAASSDELLVYLDGIRPTRIPMDVVECFFLGEGPSMIPVLAEQEITSVTVVVRLAERASEWHRRDVRKSLGQWCDGYIIVRGTWTEPLNKEVVNQMNSTLAKIKRARKTSST